MKATEHVNEASSAEQKKELAVGTNERVARLLRLDFWLFWTIANRRVASCKCVNVFTNERRDGLQKVAHAMWYNITLLHEKSTFLHQF